MRAVQPGQEPYLHLEWTAAGEHETGAHEMTRGVPMLDLKVHLKGASPERLARALLRNGNLPPRRVGKAVVGDEVAVEEIPADEQVDGVPRLGDSS